MTKNAIAKALLDAAQDSPDAPFLGGQDQLSFAEAVRVVEERAQRLESCARDAAVVLEAEASNDTVLWFLATQNAGRFAILVPEDQTYGDPRQIWPWQGPAIRIERDNRLEEVEPTGERSPVLPADAAFALFTSGSTGNPRLALRSAASLIDEGQRYIDFHRLESGSRIYGALPLQHAFGLGFTLPVALLLRGRLDLMRRFVPRKVLAAIQTEQIDLLPMVPTMARLLLKVSPEQVRTKSPLHVLIGAGPVSSHLSEAMLSCFGVRPSKGYGSTETGAVFGFDRRQAAPAGALDPLPGVELQLGPKDADGIGDLFVRTATPFLGYLSEAGIERRDTSPDGWHCIGDRCQETATGIKGLHRADGALKRGGRTVRLEWVEQALETDEAVVDYVLNVEREKSGEDGLVAYVQMAGGRALDDVKQRLREQLPEYALPTVWRIRESIPRDQAGKVKRKALIESRANPEADTTGSELIRALTAYRVGAAASALSSSGVMAFLDVSGGARLSDVARELQLHEPTLKALVSLLAEENVLISVDDGHVTPKSGVSASDLAALSDNEAAMSEQFFTARHLAAALKDKPVDPQPARGHVQAAYRNAMTIGSAYRSNAMYRLVRNTIPGDILVLGAPAKPLEDVVSKRWPDRNVHSRNFDFDEPAVLEIPPEADFSLVLVHNAIRQLLSEDEGALGKIFNCLKPSGQLAICELFSDGGEPSGLNSRFIVDWICGGTYGTFAVGDLADDLGTAGFQVSSSSRADERFDVVVATKPPNSRP